MVHRTCSNDLSLLPIKNYIPVIFKYSDVGLGGLIVGFIYFMNASLCIYWIIRQRIEARKGNTSAAKYAIFPAYIPILLASATADILVGLVDLFVAISLDTSNDIVGSCLLALAVACQAFVLDGLAISLMQYGCGYDALKRSSVLSAIWAAVTFTVFSIRYRSGPSPLGLGLELTWGLLLMIFYMSLWLLPEHWLYRRPAAIPYSAYFGLFRAFLVITELLAEESSNRTAGSVGDCGYVIVFVVMFAVCKPYLVYFTLRSDSSWWQGAGLNQFSRFGNRFSQTAKAFSGYFPPRLELGRNPLAGVEVGYNEAHTLARAVDSMQELGAVTLLNFAFVTLHRRDPLLGAGSFSKVYPGEYKGRPVAIKLLFTLDINPEVIRRCCNEAHLLSQITHPNVVRCLGVTVLPPSMGIILEVCSYGSLAEVLRGVNIAGRRKPPLNLTIVDRMYLAMGCARGLEALHKHSANLCHRDVKSFNYLVNDQLVVKIADLELGGCFRDATTRRPKKSLLSRSLVSHSLQRSISHDSITPIAVHSPANSSGHSKINLKNNISFEGGPTKRVPYMNLPIQDPESCDNDVTGGESGSDSPSELINNRKPYSCPYCSCFTACTCFNLQSLREHMGLASFRSQVRLSSSNSDEEGNASNSSGNATFQFSGIGDDEEHMISTWQAPESLLNGHYSQAADVYSLSLVLWEIVAAGSINSNFIGNNLPVDLIGTPFAEFQHMGQDEVRKQIVQGTRPMLPQQTPLLYVRIVEKGWSVDPSHRPAAKDMVEVLENCWSDCVYSHIKKSETKVDMAPLRALNSARSLSTSSIGVLTPLLPLDISLNADVSNAVTVLQREPGWAELESGSFAVLSAEPPYLLLWATSRYVLATGLSLDILRARTPSTLDCEQTDAALRRRLFEECVTHQTPQHCMIKQQRTDGQVIDVSLHMFPIMNASISTPSDNSSSPLPPATFSPIRTLSLGRPSTGRKSSIESVPASNVIYIVIHYSVV